jgi:hypothetical protein
MIRRLGVPLLLLGLSACDGCGERPTPDAGPVDAGPPVLQEKEPNDTAATALVIERSCLVEANLGADPDKPDVDWYALRASLPKTADLVLTPPAGGDVALELVDELGTVLAQVNAAGVGGVERFPNLNVSGVAYVRVATVKRGAGGAYTLQVKLAERMPGYELEPNERRVDATPVGLGQAISGTVGHPGDVDWYQYELPQDPLAPPAAIESEPAEANAGEPDAGAPQAAGDGGALDAGTVPEKRLALRIDLSAVEGVAHELQLLTEAEAVLYSAKSRESGPLSLRNVAVRAADQRLYVTVRSAPVGQGKDARRTANPDLSYTLTVAPEDSGGNAELEPNDEPSRATELPANSYRDGFLSPKGDVDYFRLVTDGPSIAKLQVSGVDKVDLQLSVVRPVEGKPEEVLLKANEGATKEPEQLNNVACPGVCYVRVEAAPRKVDGKWVRDDENGDQPYRLTATVVPDDGSEEREPNNSASSANPLEAGRPVRGTVYPRKDVDYFQLDLRERHVKTAIKATLLGVLKVDVGLYLHRVGDDGKLTLVQTSDSAKGDRPEVVRYAAEPGLYVLEVRDAKNREANFQDSYQLTVEEADE